MGRIIIALSLQTILLAVSIQRGESIDCYVCNSQKNPKCANPMDRSGLEPVTCSKSVIDEATSAVKKGVDTIGSIFGFQGVPEGPDFKFACQKVELSNQSGDKHTFRSCSIAKSEGVDPCAMTDMVSKLTNGLGKVDFCETCDTDLCNGASQHSFTIMSVFVVPCFAFIISHWMSV